MTVFTVQPFLASLQAMVTVNSCFYIPCDYNLANPVSIFEPVPCSNQALTSPWPHFGIPLPETEFTEFMNIQFCLCF